MSSPDAPPSTPAASQPVIRLEYAHSGARSPRDQIAFSLAVANWILCLMSWIILLIHIESVLFTAPIIALMGVSLMWVAGKRQFWLMIVGICNCSVCALFVALVNIWSWGPRDAQVPFGILGCVYVLAIGVLTLYANFSSPNLPG